MRIVQRVTKQGTNNRAGTTTSQLIMDRHGCCDAPCAHGHMLAWHCGAHMLPLKRFNHFIAPVSPWLMATQDSAPQTQEPLFSTFEPPAVPFSCLRTFQNLSNFDNLLSIVNASAVPVDNALRRAVSIKPHNEKMRSDSTDVAGMDKWCLATTARLGKLL